jgi:hypothetical protein
MATARLAALLPLLALGACAGQPAPVDHSAAGDADTDVEADADAACDAGGEARYGQAGPFDPASVVTALSEGGP